MAGFASQDEGYSEDPLTAAIFGAAPFALKNREYSVTALGASRSGPEFPTWMIQRISNLSISRKTGKLRLVSLCSLFSQLTLAYRVTYHPLYSLIVAC